MVYLASRRRYAAEQNTDWAHWTLDILGLVPGPGELADVANMTLYLGEGNYIDAILSLISMLPGFGDAVAKPARYAIQMGKKIPDAIIRLIKTNSSVILNMIQKLASHPKLGQYANKMAEIYSGWLTSDAMSEAANGVYEAAQGVYKSSRRLG